MTGPLDGIRVLELGAYVAGPFATKLLADMGADVIKIERPENETATRVNKQPYDGHGHPSFTWRFLNYNTSKRSVTLDLKTEEGKTVLAELVADADAVVQNLRPGAMDALGFDWEELHAISPSLVYCSVTGYGSEGPFAGAPALDTLIQGVSGFATQIGDRERPESSNVLIVDIVTGLYIAWSVTMALYERYESGEGQQIDISMLDVAVSMLGHQIAEYTGSVHGDACEPSYGPAFAPNGYFETADGYVSLFIPGEDYWRWFCSAIDRPEWATEGSPYETDQDRLDNRDELRKELESILADRTTGEWLAYFEEREETVLAGPVYDIDEMMTHPQVEAQDAVVERTHPELGTYFTPNVVPAFSRTSGSLSEAPGLGADTDEVLSSLGYSERERRRLHEEGIV